MKQVHDIALLVVAVVASVFLASCGKDYQDDIDKLNAQHGNLDQRLTSVETQVTTINNHLSVLSKLSTAVEKGFYVTRVKTTVDGYELTLSNGSVITLYNGPDNTLTMAPAISMTPINGMYYWTQNGMLLTDVNGQLIRASEMTPIVKYDVTLQQWLISFDGGVTFVNVNQAVSIVINDTVLMQIVNTYVSRYNTTLISEEILYQIISTYIQKNYAQLFNVDVLNQVVTSYVQQNSSQLFSYELLEQIFSQYNYEYATSHIKVEEITNVLKAFITDHQEILVNNEVLYEIISNYFKVNKTTVFTNDMLLEIIENFIKNNQNLINVELLQQVVFSFIDQHQDIIVDNTVIQSLLMQYVEKYYVQIFSQEILQQCINTYIVSNSSTIFNETLISEIINNYVQNNYSTFITSEVINQIITNYMSLNSTTIINMELLVEIISGYFEKNYDFFIDRTIIQKMINTYIEEHQSTLIGVDIVEQVILGYIQNYYTEIFDYDFLTLIVTNYFKENMQVLNQYIGTNTAVVKSVKADNEVCSFTLNDGKTISLVVFDAFARLRDRVQSIAIMPNSNGHVLEKKTDYSNSEGLFELECFVTPVSMTKVICDKLYKDITLEVMTVDGNGNVGSIKTFEPFVKAEGVLSFQSSTAEYGKIKAIALHLRENKIGGTDIMTDFCVVDTVGEEPQTPGYKTCPDDHHPHMIDLGLPSGTLWACCNVGAKIPEYDGNYYAWGETTTKSKYNWQTYSHCTNYTTSITCIDLGDIAGTEYDVAHVLWKENWRMPTFEQTEELRKYCKAERVTQNNFQGVKVTGNNGGAIFLPDAKVRTDYNMNDSRITAFWSSTPSTFQTYNAKGLCYMSAGTTTVSYFLNAMDVFRCDGYPVRPVVIP